MAKKLLICWVLLVLWSVGYAQVGTNLPATTAVTTLSILKRTELLKNLNKSVAVEGYYYDGSIPMILDKFERVQVDMMLPEDSYVPIVGPVPAGLKWGSRIKIEGKVLRPTSQDPPTVRQESVILKVESPQKIKVTRPPEITSSALVSQLKLKPYLPREVIGIPGQKYAVLIAGGGSPSNNHVRYWNDLKTMYNILTANGYRSENIYVVYADGIGRDSTMRVNYSATRGNISTLFNTLATKLTNKDTLYIMLNDHGGGILTTATGWHPPGVYGGVLDTNGDENESYSEASLNIDVNGDGDKTDVFRIDETLSLWNQFITDDQFAAEVNKIRNYKRIIIQMKQCFSGGFIADLTSPNRIVMSSCSPTEISWAHSSLQFGEFTFWYFAALTGNKPDGSGSVNANSNGDSYVSIVEAYNFAKSNDSWPEVPHYEDNGVSPAQSTPVPANGDGELGASISL
jgi:hypothetical protein